MIIRDSNQLLALIENGDAAHDFFKEVGKTLDVMREAQGGSKAKIKGSVTFKLSFVLDEDVVEIDPEITAKVPKIPRRHTMTFITATGELSTEHPKQLSLFKGERDSA